MSEHTIIGLGIVIIIIAGILAVRAIKRRSEAKEEAKEFLIGLEDHFYKLFIDIIESIDIRTFDNLEDYEAYALNKIYDGAWDFIEKEIEKSENKDLLSVLARKFLTKENIDKFIEDYLNKDNTREKLLNNYGSEAIESKSDDIVAEDKVLENEFSDQDKYNEEVDKSTYDYADPEEEIHTQEEEEALNPQQDIDEEKYDSDDDSVEEVNEYIELRINRAGRPMYYHVNEYGKKQQISKQKAIDSGLEIKNVGEFRNN